MAKRYPIDKSRLFVVGHSMGAGQAVGLARSHPERWAGVACLGGGGPVPVKEELKKVPFYVGVGSDDYKRLFCKGDEAIFDSFIPLTSRGKLAAIAMSGFNRTKRLVKRPGWGIVILPSELINQHSEVVHLGEHRLMIPRRPGWEG